ncbi:MAG: TIGR01212 family radical SAM protein [Clostridia bacterium]|nr:TIGR01212 family radical SAM protein [Clostridia bacterium]
MSNRYLSTSDYFKEKFNCKVYKLALNVGYTCPNRDGKVGIGGCIFCSSKGSGDFAQDIESNFKKTIETAKQRIKEKIDDKTKFIAYFQSFTSTYMPIEVFHKYLELPLNDDSIIAINIATRPDCLPNEYLEELNKANKIKPIYVELGLQTINEEVAKFINRGYQLDQYNEAVDKLHNIGINVITHVILGLPGETTEDMINTVKYVGAKTDGIKLQLLHILKNTRLAEMYLSNQIKTLELDEYANIVCHCIANLPKNVVIYRITGDGNKEDLLAPMWSTNKKMVLNYINHKLKEKDIYQGKYLEK